MRYAEYQPAPDVRAIADRYWRLTVPRAGAVERALPDGHCELVVHLADACVRVDGEGKETPQPSCLLIGQMTSPVDLRPAGTLDVFGVRLRPEASVADATHRIAALKEIWAAAAGRWEHQLHECRFDRERVAASDAFLRSILCRWPAPDEQVRAAVQSLRRGAPVARTADLVGLSRRQLERRFQEQVGLPPKVYGRLVRFQRTLAFRRARPFAEWAEVALENGYYDQAHLVRDFRQFAGRAPTLQELRAGGLERSLAARDAFFQDEDAARR
ncbi:MAG: DUF6597 domain-containing transcriptional factor [Bryobacteraceae bacterium]